MDVTQAGPQDLPKIVELLASRGWDDSNTLDHGVWFVARDGTVVGCAQVVEVEPGHSVVDQVLVDEARRGQGIGRELMRAVMTSSAGSLYLCCHEDRLRFYDHFGFEDIGVERAPESVQDHWKLIEDYPAPAGHDHFYLRAR